MVSTELLRELENEFYEDALEQELDRILSREAPFGRAVSEQEWEALREVRVQIDNQRREKTKPLIPMT